MTILEAILCMAVTFCTGYFVCVIYLAAPLLQRISRLIGKLNQKDYDIMRWQLAYNKANNDFMILAETQVIPKDNKQWIDWVWTEDKPYPETLDTIVDVKFGDDGVFKNDTVDYWYIGSESNSNCWKPSEKMSELIVAYRVVN